MTEFIDQLVELEDHEKQLYWFKHFIDSLKLSLGKETLDDLLQIIEAKQK